MPSAPPFIESPAGRSSACRIKLGMAPPSQPREGAARAPPPLMQRSTRKAAQPRQHRARCTARLATTMTTITFILVIVILISVPPAICPSFAPFLTLAVSSSAVLRRPLRPHQLFIPVSENRNPSFETQTELDFDKVPEFFFKTSRAQIFSHRQQQTWTRVRSTKRCTSRRLGRGSAREECGPLTKQS